MYLFCVLLYILKIFYNKKVLKSWEGTSLVVLWLRLHGPNAGGPGLIPSQGTRPYVLQLRVCMLPTETQHSQIYK